jgi:hypothetical protein
LLLNAHLQALLWLGLVPELIRGVQWVGIQKLRLRTQGGRLPLRLALLLVWRQRELAALGFLNLIVGGKVLPNYRAAAGLAPSELIGQLARLDFLLLPPILSALHRLKLFAPNYLLVLREERVWLWGLLIHAWSFKFRI